MTITSSIYARLLGDVPPLPPKIAIPCPQASLRLGNFKGDISLLSTFEGVRRGCLQDIFLAFGAVPEMFVKKRMSGGWLGVLRDDKQTLRCPLVVLGNFQPPPIAGNHLTPKKKLKCFLYFF